MKPARYQPLVTGHLKKNGSGVISKPNKVQIRSSTAEYLQKIWRAMRRQRRGIRAECSFKRQRRIAERPQDSGPTRR